MIPVRFITFLILCNLFAHTNTDTHIRSHFYSVWCCLVQPINCTRDGWCWGFFFSSFGMAFSRFHRISFCCNFIFMINHLTPTVFFFFCCYCCIESLNFLISFLSLSFCCALKKFVGCFIQYCIYDAHTQKNNKFTCFFFFIHKWIFPFVSCCLLYSTLTPLSGFVCMLF